MMSPRPRLMKTGFCGHVSYDYSANYYILVNFAVNSQKNEACRKSEQAIAKLRNTCTHFTK